MRDITHQVDLLLLGLILGTVVHEMCHATAAWCLGLQVRLIRIGQGPVLLHIKLADAWLRVSCLPIGGVTKYLPRPGMGRPVEAATVAAGPLSNLALLLVLAAVAVVWPSMGAAIVTVALAQIVLIVITLLPFQVGGQPTDGRQLLDMRRPLPEWERPLHTAYLAVFAPGAGTQPPPTPEFAEMFYQEHRPDRYVEAWARKDAWNSMHRVLQRNRLSSAERTMVLWFLIWTNCEEAATTWTRHSSTPGQRKP